MASLLQFLKNAMIKAWMEKCIVFVLPSTFIFLCFLDFLRWSFNITTSPSPLSVLHSLHPQGNVWQSRGRAGCERERAVKAGERPTHGE